MEPLSPSGGSPPAPRSRLSDAEALDLLRHGGLLELAHAATRVRDCHADPARVSYVVDRNVNYTDICGIHCSFCAFHRRPGDPAGTVLRAEDLRAKAEVTRALGGTGFLLQGGVNPDLPWTYYLDLLRFLRHDLGLWVHGFSPVEIRHMARLSGQSLEQTLADLREAGLGSLPGGGAEILADPVRHRIAPRKGGARDWLEVMDAAHALGMVTTATMMYGITESLEDRVTHLRLLREQQDRALARRNGGGHLSFTAWPFQSRGTVWEGKVPPPSELDYLRTVAVSRIYLDNIPHLQSSWVTMGRRIGQLALHFGCDDLGSLMIEENVVSAAGTRHPMDRKGLDHLIRTAGFAPWQRDTLYGEVPPRVD